ncbi:MAG: dioxygenase [Alysiella sp.]|uniref:dioxygenase n=1 Tax=Alysiella sp. TaxID=1872483 RepID=UPI0026DB680E|nr:dioxygenase [Alysiella sp.]MDO4434445.1 dioxygenase [Alysiella sp.]
MSHKLTQTIQTESHTDVRETLIFLLEECSLDQAPSHEEIAQWQTILHQRGGKFTQLAQLCEQYLQENR